MAVTWGHGLATFFCAIQAGHDHHLVVADEQVERVLPKTIREVVLVVPGGGGGGGDGDGGGKGEGGGVGGGWWRRW